MKPIQDSHVTSFGATVKNMSMMWHTSNFTITRLWVIFLRRKWSNNSLSTQASWHTQHVCETGTYQNNQNIHFKCNKNIILTVDSVQWIHKSTVSSCVKYVHLSCLCQTSHYKIVEMRQKCLWFQNGIRLFQSSFHPQSKAPQAPTSQQKHTVHGWCVKGSDLHTHTKKISTPPFTEHVT